MRRVATITITILLLSSIAVALTPIIKSDGKQSGIWYEDVQLGLIIQMKTTIRQRYKIYNGTEWGEEQRLDDGASSYPAITVEDDNVHVVFVDDRVADQEEIYYTMYDGVLSNYVRKNP